jgi:hypothetical protein
VAELLAPLFFYKANPGLAALEIILKKEEVDGVIINRRPRAFYLPADDLFCAEILSAILLLHSAKYDARLGC